MNFEERLKEATENSIVKMVSDSGSWVLSRYENRLQIPPDFIQSIWQLVDRDKLKQQIAERIEAELADRIMNHIATELTTDIKQILSVKERREAIRALARQHMDAIMSAGTLRQEGE